MNFFKSATKILPGNRLQKNFFFLREPGEGGLIICPGQKPFSSIQFLFCMLRDDKAKLEAIKNRSNEVAAQAKMFTISSPKRLVSVLVTYCETFVCMLF